MKIDWEGKSITVGKGTTTIEAVGSMISIETDGDVVISGDTTVDVAYISVEEMIDRMSEKEAPKI